MQYCSTEDGQDDDEQALKNAMHSKKPCRIESAKGEGKAPANWQKEQGAKINDS